MKIKVVYYNHKTGNFGDELNKWIWPKIFNKNISGYCNHGKLFTEENNKEKNLFYGIGTLINSTIPQLPNKIIFGSGAGIGSKPTVDNSYNFYFVRGPKTAEILGLDASYVITDPAILVHDLYINKRTKKYRVSFMPHYDSEENSYWKILCKLCGIHYISPQNKDVDFLLSEIIASKKIITEAMHGAIVADALRVPWIAVQLYSDVNDFKWADYCNSMNLKYRPFKMPQLHSPKKNLNYFNLSIKLILSLFCLIFLSQCKKGDLSNRELLKSKLALIHSKIRDLKNNVC